MNRPLTTLLRLLLLLHLTAFSTAAQITITGQLPPDYPFRYLVYTHTGELELPSGYDTLQLQEPAFELRLSCKSLCSVTIGLPQKYAARTMQYHTFYLQPGDQLLLDFRYVSGSQELEMHVQGPNAAGYQAWAAFNRQYSPPIRYLQQFYDLQPTLPNLRDTIVAKIESILYPYDRLLHTGEIDTVFHAIVSAHYREHICQTLISDLHDKQWGKFGQGLEPAARDRLAAQLIQYGKPAEDSPFRDAAYAFRRISRLRYERLRALHLEYYEDMPDSTVEAGGQAFQVPAKYASVLFESNDTLREFLLARYLHFSYSSMIGPEFDRTREPALAYFKAAYPVSRYQQPIAEARRENPIRYAEIGREPKPESDAPQDQAWRPSIIDDIGAMTDFTFANKGVDLKLGKYYIDLWATWCQPCLQSFAYNADADSLLSNYGFHRLYIAINDQGSTYTRWLDTIKRYQLNGRHVLAGKVLREWLSEEFFSGGPIVLPRHLLLIDGRIVEQYAPGPADLKALEEKLRAL